MCRNIYVIYVKYVRYIHIVTNFSLVTGSKISMACLIKKLGLFSKALT